MILRNKLILVKISRYDNVTSYFMRINQVRDQISIIGEKLDDKELVNVALNGLPKSWEPIFKGFCARENLSYWKRLWDDCIYEETWEDYNVGNKEYGEEKLALVRQAKKRKGKGSKGNNDGGTS
jgi:hypothetical protein